MDAIFANYLLHEADNVNPVDIKPAQQNVKQPPQQQQEDPQMSMPGADKALQPPDTPPDFTTDPNQGGDAAGADPSATGGDPSAQGDPSQDPNADPNTQGMEDPNAAATPAGMGGPTIQSPEGQIDQDEKDTFSDLKPEQMVIMKAELRDNYKALHGLIVDTIEKINKISHTTYDDSMLDFIVRKFAGLKSQIRDTIVDTFNTRTYVANKIELARFTFIFNQLTNMLTQIYQSRLKRQQKVQELNKTNKLQHDAEEFPLFSRGYETQ